MNKSPQLYATYELIPNAAKWCENIGHKNQSILWPRISVECFKYQSSSGFTGLKSKFWLNIIATNLRQPKHMQAFEYWWGWKWTQFSIFYCKYNDFLWPLMEIQGTPLTKSITENNRQRWRYAHFAYSTKTDFQKFKKLTKFPPLNLYSKCYFESMDFHCQGKCTPG